jgi:hypothetical protein
VGNFSKDYSQSLNSDEAADLRDKTNLNEQIALGSFGLAVPLTIMTMVKSGQQSRARKAWQAHKIKMNFSVIPNEDGFMIGLNFSL